MKKDELFKVLNDIDDKYIEEAGLSEKKRSVWKLLVPVMAVLIAAVMIPFMKPVGSDAPQDVIAVPETVEPEVKEEGPIVTGKGVTVRAFVPPTAPTGLSDMIGFVMVGDNGYLQVIQQMDIPLEKGELIGTANACIGEWEIREPEEGELVSNMEGTVYEAAGYDPDFRLVFVNVTGGEWLMEREGGYTLYTGKDIFEDRLHVREYLSSIYVQNDEDWSWNRGNERVLNIDESVLSLFLDELNDAEIIGLERDMEIAELAQFEKNHAVEKKYVLTLSMIDHTAVQLKLYEDGIVMYLGSGVPYMVLDGTGFRSLFEACTAE